MALATLHEKNDCLASGYIREQYSDEYPAELNQFISTYLGIITLRFAIINEEYKTHNIIQKNGSLIKSDTMMVLMIGCPLGVNKGITTFRVKCIKPCSFDVIGMISDINECTKISTLNTSALLQNEIKSKVYWWCNKRYIISQSDSKSSLTYTKGIVDTKWKEGDILSIEVNFPDNKVTFYCNDQLAQNIILDNHIYYLFMCVQWDDSKYELIYD